MRLTFHLTHDLVRIFSARNSIHFSERILAPVLWSNPFSTSTMPYCDIRIFIFEIQKSTSYFFVIPGTRRDSKDTVV